MFNLKALGVQELPDFLHVALTGDLESPAPPEYHFIVMALSAQLDQSKCYAILDLEEVNIEDFPQVNGLPEQEILGWSGDELPGMLGYGSMSVYNSRFGPCLSLSVAGSAGNSASSIYIVPEELIVQH